MVERRYPEPPSPGDKTAWQGIPPEQKTWWEARTEGLRDLGISVECKPVLQLGDLPGFTDFKGGIGDSLSEFWLSAEFGRRTSATTVLCSGKFTMIPNSREVSGDVTLALRGTGITVKGKWSSGQGLEIEGGVVWEKGLYTAGVDIQPGGEVIPTIGVKVGPVSVEIDPVKFGQKLMSLAPQAADWVSEGLRDVGGVMIQFDLGLLAMALTDRPPPGVETLGDVSLVSLKRVLAARMAGDMTDLGEVTSVHGFLLDHANGDIILIGKHEPWAPRISLDVLVAVLQSVWRDGLSPYVSIDPDPRYELEPHHARFGGVSPGLEESSLLKIMFDADYRMKQFDSGKAGMEVAGVKSRVDLAREDLKRKQPELFGDGVIRAEARLWLSPQQPNIGDIWQLESEAGSLYVYRPGVEILTEIEHLVRVDQSVSRKTEKRLTGKDHVLGAMACLGYTRHYDKLERRFPELKQLRQVFELVEFARILNMRGVESALLRELSRLPTSRDPHKKRYRVVGPNRLRGRKIAWRLSGGVQAKLRVSEARLRLVEELETTFRRLHAVTWRAPVVRMNGLFQPVVREARMLSRVLVAEASVEDAFIELSEGNVQEALLQASTAIEANPDAGDVYSLRAFIYYEIGEYRKAASDLDDAIRLGARDSVVYNNRGLARSKLGDRDGAIEDYTAALEIDPRDVIAYFNRSLDRTRLGDCEGAIEDATAALEINPRFAQAYDNRGLARSTLGDREGAIEDYNAALEIDPRSREAHNNRGVARSELGDHEGAIEDYTVALEIDPRNAEVYYNRGNTRAELGDHEGAIEDYNAALEINPRYAQAYDNRGIARKNLGDCEGAIEDYNAALEIDPRSRDAHNNRAVARSELGDHAGAVEDYTAALEIDPRYVFAYLCRGDERFRLAQERQPSAAVELLRTAEEDVRKAMKLGGKNWSDRELAEGVLQEILDWKRAH